MGRTKDTITTILDILRGGKNALVTGSPGGGKSEVATGPVIEGLAEFLKIPVSEMSLTDLRPCYMDPIDYRGYPFPDVTNKTTTWLMPDFLPKTGPGLLLIEEISSAPQAHHFALYQLCQERRLGDYVLPDDIFIVATGNRKTDGCGVKRMPTAFLNRFGSVEFEIDPEDWKEWAIGHGIDYRIIAATNYLPELLTEWDGMIDGPQSSPRSLAAFSDILVANKYNITATADVGGRGSYETPRYDSDSQRAFRAAKAHIGEIDAAQLIGFLALFDLIPAIPEILANPEGVPVPDRVDVKFATIAALQKNVGRDDIKNALIYVDRFPDPFRAIFGTDFGKINAKSAHKTMPFIEWIEKNSNLFRVDNTPGMG